MLRINFTEEEIKALDYERYHHLHPKVQKKMEVLYLKSQGLPHKEIRRLCGISKTTLTTYLKQYQEGGLELLKDLDYKGQPSKLLDHASGLEQYFMKHPPRTAVEAQAVIEKLTGIKRSPTQVRSFLKRLGLRYRKVGFVPGKGATPDKIIEQEQFKEQELKPRLAEAKMGKRHFFLWMQPTLYTEPS